MVEAEAEEYLFNFEYEGNIYSQTKREEAVGLFAVNDVAYEMEASPEFLLIIKGFVKSALQGKTIHVKVL